MKNNSNKIQNKDDQKMKPEKVGSSKIEASQWAELSDDLVGEIISNLCLLSDQVRFSAVCKNWLQSANQYNKNIVSLPWVLYCNASLRFIQCQVNDPLASSIKKQTLVYRKYLPEFNILFPYYYYYPSYKMDTSIHKTGWIFRSIRMADSYFTNFVLFSPFTEKEIVLPRLAHLYRSTEIVTKTISTRPDFPDCVFLVLCYTISKNTITVHIFRHGYQKWKIQEFGAQGLDAFRFNSIPMYMEGIFYFVFPSGKLVLYDVASGDWKVDSVLVDHPINEWIYEALFELRGELMLIGICRYSGYIKMFDKSRKACVPVESLGNQSVFINHNSIFLATVKEGKSNYAVLPNNIYCGRDLDHNVYSLKSGELTKLSNESEITKWAKSTNSDGYWLEPPDDLVKGNSHGIQSKLMQRQTMLPVVTKPGKLEELGFVRWIK